MPSYLPWLSSCLFLFFSESRMFSFGAGPLTVLNLLAPCLKQGLDLSRRAALRRDSIRASARHPDIEWTSMRVRFPIEKLKPASSCVGRSSILPPARRGLLHPRCTRRWLCRLQGSTVRQTYSRHVDQLRLSHGPLANSHTRLSALPRSSTVCSSAFPHSTCLSMPSVLHSRTGSGRFLFPSSSWP